jgi:hypothetical protein
VTALWSLLPKRKVPLAAANATKNQAVMRQLSNHKLPCVQAAADLATTRPDASRCHCPRDSDGCTDSLMIVALDAQIAAPTGVHTTPDSLLIAVVQRQSYFLFTIKLCEFSCTKLWEYTTFRRPLCPLWAIISLVTIKAGKYYNSWSTSTSYY